MPNVWKLPRRVTQSVVLDHCVRFTIAPDYREWDRIWHERVAANVDKREARADNVCVFHRRQA